MVHSLLAGMLLAQEGEEESEGIDLLLPPSSELIAGIIAFAIVFFFMWKWAAPAINRALENRRQAIAGQLKEAEKAKQEAESLLRDYQEQLAGARSEADRIIDEARQTAEALRADVVGKAEREAEEIRRKTQEELAAERARAGSELRREVAGLSLDVAERVIGGALDRDAQRALVDRYIEELEGTS